MLEASGNAAEKKLNAETNRLVGELQLHQYGIFLEQYNKDLLDIKEKLPNNLNIYLEPILLENTETERASMLNLIHSDNKLLTRILASLSSVCEEINLLVKEANGYYINLVFYGDDVNTTDNNNNFAIIGKLMELLQKVNCFIERCQQVISLLLRQLCAILGKGLYTTNSGACFPEPLDCLAELLVCLLSLDGLVVLPTIKDHWQSYHRFIKTIQHSNILLNSDQLRSLDKYLSTIETALLTGNIYKRALDRMCLDEKLVIVVKNSSLLSEIAAYINQLLNDLEHDEDTICFTQIWLQVNALVVFEYYLSGAIERKQFKRLSDINKKVSACTLSGNVLWYPEQFLLKHVPILSKSVDLKAIECYRLNQIAIKSQNLLKDTHTLTLQSCYWMIEIETITKRNSTKFLVKHLQEMANLLIDGIKLIKKIGEIVKYIMNLHADKGRPMAKSVLLALCRLIEILKCFQFVFHKRLMPLVYIVLMITQQLSHKALTILHGIRKSFTQEKSYREQQLDVLSALTVCEQSLRGPNTNQRILIAKLALSASGLSYDNLIEIRSVLNRLELISSVHAIFNRLCDCSFLYWHQIYILPVYFSKLIETKTDLSRFYLIFSALSDCAHIAGDGFSHISALTDANCLATHLFKPLNQIVETNLRLQTHLHLKLSPSDPFHTSLALNFRKFSPSRIDQFYVNIKSETEHYLSTMFYNLTTVVLHDWKTYGEMRRLASLQYGLDTVEDNLSIQTLEQGLDVLEIMRNINVFVGNYLYNLNTQVFIEELSNNKHLNTINIFHVANSIRTHGIGIMNTAVNFTYQFLQKKFFIFSQFMFDEHIKSRLLKDLRFFAEHKIEFNQMYPYDRADKFNVAIRTLGLNPKGLSYLDLFRKLITQIGNAMGYIRLIRSGGRRFLAEGTCFIPDLKRIIVDDFTMVNNDFSAASQLTNSTVKCLIGDLTNLVENFEEATEYFQLLVNVFIPVFRNSNNIHLKNFYIIVPSLTINFIEHSLTCKERLNKKNKIDASFTDDGFAIGLAYIIELLDQENQLNSLHWFYSIQMKFAQERRKIAEQITLSNKQDDKLQQTLSLTEKRIMSFEKEFQLLYYNYSSARIFFQA